MRWHGSTIHGGSPSPRLGSPRTHGEWEELTALRASIDNIDAAVVHMLAERSKATQRVGRLKAEHQLPPADPAREQGQITRLRELAARANLDPVFAEKFLGL